MKKSNEDVFEAKSLIPEEIIERKIFIIRGQKVIIDKDLAELYEIKTKEFNRSVKRNLVRFPTDFMFQLSIEELQNLRCHFGTSSWGGRRYLPYVFTEHGVAMLSAILKSEKAVEMSIFIIRAFIKMRELLATHKDLANQIEKIQTQQKDQGARLSSLHSLVKQLITMPQKPKKKIGFETEPLP